MGDCARLVPQRFTCQGCKHVWEGHLLVNVPVTEALTYMKGIRCPTCQNDKIGLGGKSEYSGALGKKTVEERAAWWIMNGEVGISSASIVAALTDELRTRAAALGSMGMPDVPHDPDDYRRCRLLLGLIPEWKPQLARVATIYPKWGPMVREWMELDALWDEESPSGSCPQMYELMKRLADEGEECLDTD